MNKCEATSDPKPCPIHSDCIHREICIRSLCLLFFETGVTWDDLKDAIRQWLQRDELQTLHHAMPLVPFGPREPLCPKCRAQRLVQYDYYCPDCPDCGTDIDRFVMANRHLFKTDIVYTVISKVIFIALMEVLDE